MVVESDAMKGGGSSMIKVGTTGKISVLMRKELESTRSESSRKCPTGPVSVSCSRRNQGNVKKSGGGGLRSFSHGSQGGTQRKTCYSRLSAHHLPFLSSDEVSPHRTPDRRELPGKNGCCGVEIVDLNCGASTSERGWSRPMASRLKKLGFSRLSQTIN